MRKVLFAVLLSLSVISCSGPGAIKIEGVVKDAAEGSLVLKKLEVSTQKVIDTIRYSKSGEFSSKINLKEETNPQFYYLYYNSNKVASLLLSPGDKVEIDTDTTGANPVLEGSLESRMLTDLEKQLSRTNSSFDSLMTLMQQAIEQGEDDKASALNYELGKLYVKQKQRAIKHIYENPRAISNILLLYHRVSPELPLFANVNDVLILQRVHDTLSTIMPGSPYLSIIMAQIEEKEKNDLFNSKILSATETGFPDLSLPDVNAQPKNLSELGGNVILLSFWTVTEPEQRMLNQEYLNLYRKYDSRGFELYQVSLDTDKTAWATAVKDQDLPWVSVCDGLGLNSMSIRTYNITELPANYIIDREGNIVAKNLFGRELDRKINSLL